MGFEQALPWYSWMFIVSLNAPSKRTPLNCAATLSQSSKAPTLQVENENVRISMQVVVLAGGFGTRLRPWTYEIPKPILPMLDKTLLEHVVEVVPSGKVDEVVVAGGYKVDDIEEYFNEADVSYDVRIVKETEPLGTGGALGNCRDVVSGQFVCLNGDIISSLDMQVGLDLHQKNGGIGTLALWEVEDPTLLES